MKLADPIKLVSQLIDLPIVDKDERSCGIVDDVELDGAAGKVVRVKALLVGPGAYRQRMPAWLYWVVRKIAGERMACVPAAEILEVGTVVKLKCAAETVKLHVVENRASTWIPRRGAL